MFLNPCESTARMHLHACFRPGWPWPVLVVCCIVFKSSHNLGSLRQLGRLRYLLMIDCAEKNGCGMAGMAGTVRVMRQTCNSVKMLSIMYISLSAGRFSAACNLSLYPSLLRSVDGWEAREIDILHRAAHLIHSYIQNSTVIISATPIFG